VWQDPRRDEGSSYYYPDNRTSYPTDRPAYNSYSGSVYEIDERPPSNTNDRPIYNNEKVSYPKDAFATEATDRAIALALAEEEESEYWRYYLDLGLGYHCN
jgi:hypothetical protein